MKPISCIVLPTYNEADNIEKVIDGIFNHSDNIITHALHVMVVDDNSPDGTQNIVKNLMKKYKNLHLLLGDKKGLGEAYKRGINYTIEKLNPDLIFEMDADGQHDPDMIPLFIELANHGFSLVIGSRFAPGGSTPDFSAKRKTISLLGNWMIRVLGGIPRIRDCTSGFRCIKAELFKSCNLEFLSTRGYSFQSSLLCELLRNGAKVVEIPIVFKDRLKGKSKLTLRDNLEFLFNIGKIRFRQSKEFIKFCVVGISGVVVNLFTYLLLTRVIGVHLSIASPFAIEISILSNFLLNHIWTFNGRKVESPILKKLLKFHLVSGTAGVLNYVIFLSIVYILHVNDIIANLIGIAAAMVINYSLNSWWTWREIGIEGKEVY